MAVTNSKTPLSYAQKTKPDLILTDYNMPLLNGAAPIDAFRRIADQTPIILMSTSSMAIEYADQAQITAFFVKPILLSEFTAILKEIVTSNN